jgi:tryptophan halogenase
MNDKAIKSVLIVGGGTAGWMAAAAIRRAVGGRCSVTLVESDEIGIVGVGEATVPTIRDFNVMVGLDEAEFMRETKASLKLGIEFVDWGRIGGRYLHPFGWYGTSAQGVSVFAQEYLRLAELGRAGPLDDYSVCAQAARRGRVGRPSSDPRSPMAGFFYAYHFDAGLYALYLRRFCERIGVKREEGRIVDVLQRGEDGFVAGVKLADGRVLEAELFVDCSGFRGLLIEQALQAGWEDWSRWLPVDRAVAVPCAKVEGITPYTRSTADAAGWRWRIPLQHRTGNGYVFCSAHLSEDAAAARLLETLDAEALADPRVIRFQAGRRRKYWDKNVVTLGLSSGFVEPLESTSIHMVHAGINKLLQHWPDRDFSPVNVATYNERVIREYEAVRDFVILHYHASTRDDSEFWRYVRDMPVPDALAARVAAFRDRGLLYSVVADEYFAPTSWLSVMWGQGIRPERRNPLYDRQDATRLATAFEALREQFARLVDGLPEHEAFLDKHRMAQALAA